MPTSDAARTAPLPGAPTLRGRLSRLVVVALLPVALLAAAVATSGYRAERGRTEARTVEVARGVALAVERELRGMTASLEALALSPSLGSGDLDAFRREAAALTARHYPGANVLVVAPDGRQLMNLAVPPGQPLPSRVMMDTTRQVIETGRPAVSDVFTGQPLSRPVVSVDVPVPGPDGAVSQVLALGFPASAFAEIIRQQRPRRGSVVAILDRRGTVVAREPDPGAAWPAARRYPPWSQRSTHGARARR
ncbi:cache domain-containing protein [Roseomonas sp. CCTCC AB2023176]|uniref:cache domain-containing protein n=1 Tax=Roseomonas sp. CCTCC AB2023176 TaxID=3342640 RepID=UPI0035DC0F55